MRRSALALLCVLVVNCGGGGSSDGRARPFGIDSRPSLTTFDLPTSGGSAGVLDLVAAFPNLSFTAAIFLAGVPGEDRVVVAQQDGRVYAFTPTRDVTAQRSVLDISDRLVFGGEQGLLGLAFDPAFATNRYVYVNYSRRGDGATIVARFTWNSSTDRVDTISQKIVLVVPQPAANHNGGMLAFGPDGDLYVALGDGGGANDQFNNGQNLGSLLGKILRIDVHPADPARAYDVPFDNPFVGVAGVLPEIWAFGLRNPFRFSFDRQTGRLWVGDVGQNSVEEIDLVVRGANYGWPRFEGTNLFRSSVALARGIPHTPPIYQYDHGLGNAVIGGYVYRGARIASLIGHYLFGDYGSGRIWALVYDGTNPASNSDVAIASNPTSFGEDNSGEVYVVAQNAGVFQPVETGGGGSAAALLSQTGLFTDLAALTPATGLIAYDLNMPFWSDGATKRRWIGVPESSKVTFSAAGAWTFPVGTVIVEHFEMDMTDGDPNSRRRLETRVLTRTATEWLGFTYRWNADETDANLLAGRESESLTIRTAGGGTRVQQYDYPSRTDCLQCHTSAAGFALGLVTRGMNRDFDYGAVTDNQLRTLNHIGYFDRDVGSASQYGKYGAIDDTAFTIAARARAYLAVNCAQCHRPGGPTPVDLDLRFETADASMNAIGVVPTAGDLGIAGARIIDRGHKERSVLWQRMRNLDGTRMPPLSSHRVDQAAVDVIGSWIEAL